MDTKQISETINLIFQILMLAVPIAVALIVWFLRTYVKSAKAEKTLAAIIRIANAAVDFAEDLDQRGDLAKYLKAWNVPDDVASLTSNGLKKLHLAGQWAETEFARLGIKLTDTEAQAWIASEYQRRQGGAGSAQPPATKPDIPATPPTPDMPGYQTGAAPQIQSPPHSPPPGNISSEAELAQLATQAAQYVAKLKADQPVDVPESEVAVGWVQIEAAKRRLMVSEAQIAAAVATALAANETTQPSS